jgi:hypothetical protein
VAPDTNGNLFIGGNPLVPKLRLGTNLSGEVARRSGIALGINACILQLFVMAGQRKRFPTRRIPCTMQALDHEWTAAQKA